MLLKINFAAHQRTTNVAYEFHQVGLSWGIVHNYPLDKFGVNSFKILLRYDLSAVQYLQLSLQFV